MNKTRTYCYLRIVCADCNAFLDHCILKNIDLEEVSFCDSVTVTCKIRIKDYQQIIFIAQKYSAEVFLEAKTGVRGFFEAMRKRPCLVIGILILVLLTAWLPTRVLFLQVEGNMRIPTNMIVEAAAYCGVDFGASRNHVRSEKVKNMLLQVMPQLQWVGINTSGCVATITVKERADMIPEDEKLAFGNIVARMDGVITHCTVENGNMVCTIGQAVQRGQVLVSGYIDNGLSILATKPKAEIYAMTNREIELITPLNVQNRGELIQSEVKYSLQIGKNLINFYNSSRISDTTCVKIYEEYVLTLPGNFQLPISLIKETWEYHLMESSSMNVDMDFLWVESSLKDYLQSQMIAGQIKSADGCGQRIDDMYYYAGKYSCIEMIGQYKQEEILDRDE